MTNREIIRELKRRGYSRVDIDTDLSLIHI